MSQKIPGALVLWCALLLNGCGGASPTVPSSPAAMPPSAATGVVQGIVKHETYVSHGAFPEGPLLGVQVIVTEGAGAGRSVTTGPDGAYRFELPAGPFRIRWSSPEGFETRDSDPGMVTAGATTTVPTVILRRSSNLPIDEWSISGTIRDGVGNPIAGASITIENDGFGLYATTSTDAGGRFRFASTHQHGGTLRVTASKNGYVPQQGYGVGEAFVPCAPSCAETANFRLLRIVRETLDGPSGMQAGETAPLSLIVELEDGSRHVFTSFAIPTSSNPAVVRVVPPTDAPYQAYAKAVAPGTATLQIVRTQPLTLTIHVVP